jgi:hypothetical protein
LGLLKIELDWIDLLDFSTHRCKYKTINFLLKTNGLFI